MSLHVCLFAEQHGKSTAAPGFCEVFIEQKAAGGAISSIRSSRNEEGDKAKVD